MVDTNINATSRLLLEQLISYNQVNTNTHLNILTYNLQMKGEECIPQVLQLMANLKLHIVALQDVGYMCPSPSEMHTCFVDSNGSAFVERPCYVFRFLTCLSARSRR